MAQDFRLGLWSFMEDIRQATVGDEPIHGVPGRPGSTDPHGRRERSSAGDQDTIKANGSSRPRVPLNSAFDLPPMDTPSKPSKPLQERPNPKPAAKSTTTTKAKHFSWTPLTFDSFDDNDWSNWESPQVSSTKSARWSGSTMGGPDEIPSMSENSENLTSLRVIRKKKSSITIDTSVRSESRPESALLSPSRLEELLPTVVNKLSPGNLQRTANNLMDEWEKSLKERDDEEQLIDFKETTA
ncbi:hypothetical protein ColKHC_02357 [Colletotrichum higginsianum]|nr:hypothetical protein ColKHC_02357 [Colletotrichum higginsianum]